MNGGELFWTALATLGAITFAAFRAHPVEMTAFTVWLVSLCAGVWKLLDREGWKALAWCGISAASFAVLMVFL
jgi:hypothetical protein